MATSAISANASSQHPLGAVQMGLIYVNPEGPNGKPDPVASAKDIRETFFRMAMDDEETVALIAGGHTFGKTHGAGDAKIDGWPVARRRRDRGSGPRLEEQIRDRRRALRHHRRPEVTWSQTPTKWSNHFFDNLFKLRVGADQEPGRRLSMEGEKGAGAGRARRARHVEERIADHADDRPRAQMDPAYEKISRRFFEHPDQFADAFARAWFKLTHRDMGPIQRYLGPLVPKETLIWQDPIPAVNHPLIGEKDVAGAESEDPRFRPHAFPSLSRPPGRRPRRSAAPTSAVARTARAFA